MKVNWKPSVNQSPILFSNRSEFTGFDIRHLRVLPGELVEQEDPFHKINIPLEGSLLAKKHSSSILPSLTRTATESGIGNTLKLDIDCSLLMN
jgi:hypothetical protein